MGKQVVFDAAARSALQEGLDILANAVKATLGPKGRNAAIERAYGPPLITKDGVSVARSITLSNRIQNMGAELVKSVASSTNSLAGDGTTTATVLAQAIYTEGSKMVAAGHNPVLIKRGIDKAVEVVLGRLKDISTPVLDDVTIKNVAIISANNDSALGELIGSVVSAVGDDGLISVEEAAGAETTVEYTEGMSIDRGYISPVFVNNQDRLTVEFDNPLVLLFDGKISSTYDVMPILEAVSEANRPLLIIAQTVESEALQTLALNNTRGSLSSCVIRAPGFGDMRLDQLGDIAAVTGAKIFSPSHGHALRDAMISDLGSARKIISTRISTSIIDGDGTKDSIAKRINSLKVQLSNASGLESYEVSAFKQRLSSLSGSIAVLRVGGVSEAEVKEKRDRVEDAINAVKAAIEEGIVPGGGSALLHCLSALDTYRDNSNLITEELVGVDVVSKAIRAPFVQILCNAGIEHHLFMEHIAASDNLMSGFNAYTGSPSEDMVADGVIDPVKVVRTALENAASSSGTLLTTEVVVFEEDSSD